MTQKRITLYLFDDEYDFVSNYCESEKISMNRYFQDWIRDNMKKIDKVTKDEVDVANPIKRVWKTKDEMLGIVKNKFEGLCPHGSMKGLCKKGCS